MTQLLVVVVRAIEEFEKQWGAFITTPFLEQVYEDHFNVATHLENAAGREEKRNNLRQWYMRAFFLFLIGCTIFTDKSNKLNDLTCLNVMQDLCNINEWAQYEITLAYLYHCMYEAIDAAKGSIGGYLTLCEIVIYFSFIFLVYLIIIYVNIMCLFAFLGMSSRVVEKLVYMVA
jgi:hypothetical protein